MQSFSPISEAPYELRACLFATTADNETHAKTVTQDRQRLVGKS